MIKIADIAREMDLSEATISNALNGKGRMRPETRERIRRRAEELGYVAVHRVRHKTQKKVIVIAEDMRPTVVPQMLEGIRAEALKHGMYPAFYDLGFRSTPNHLSLDHGPLNEAVAALLEGVEGAILGIVYVAQYTRPLDGLMNGLPYPIVCTYCSRGDEIPFVHYDEQQGAYLAVKSLIDSGCRHVAMVSGPVDSIGMIRRNTGYQRALVDHNLAFDPAMMRIGSWSPRSGYEAARELLESGREIDAMFVQNDAMAIGAMHAITEMGLRVPDDIAVVGFDNSSLASGSFPPLTSVDPNLKKIGGKAFRMVLKRARSKKDVMENILVPCTLAVRQSTKQAVNALKQSP